MTYRSTAIVRRGTGARPVYRVALALGLLGSIVVALAWTAGRGTVDAGTLTSPQATPGQTPKSLEDVIAALRDAGLAVEPTDQTVKHEFFAAPATILRVDGQDLQVLVYPSEAARAADSAQISEDGSQIGPSMIMWVATPHFAAAGNVLTLFVSDDEALAAAIAAAIATLAPAEAASPVASPVGTS